jgi:hypothetical protein
MENNPTPKKMKLRLNLFDIIFISCALIIAVFFILYSNRSDSGGGFVATGTQETVVYTVELRGMIPEAAVLIQPGDALVDRIEKRAMGNVISVELESAKGQRTNSLTGDHVISEIPNRIDAIITIEALAHVTENEINVSGFVIRYGVGISLTGPKYGSAGVIINIERDD